MRGGVERYIVELARGIEPRFDVTLWAQDVDMAILSSSIQFVRMPMLRWPSWIVSFFFAMATSLFPKTKTVDLVHSHGANCFKQDIVTAHSCHKAWFVLAKTGVSRFSIRWWVKMINPLHHLTMLTEQIQYRKDNVKLVVAISNVVKGDLMRHYRIPEQKIRVVYNGVNCTEFGSDERSAFREEIRVKHGFNKHDTVLLFVGNEFQRKGLEPLLHAQARLNLASLKLVVVGKGNEMRFRNLARQLEIEERVVFAGSTSEVKKYYAASEIFVLPSAYEPFGLVVLEAMASGLPVVCSKNSGVAELIEDGVDGLLVEQPTVVSSLSNAIERLLDAEIRLAIGKKAREKAECYTWEKVCREMTGIYEEVMEA